MAFTNTNGDISQINYKQLAGSYYRIFVNGIPLDRYPWLSKMIKSIEINEVSSGPTSEEGVASGITPTDIVTITMLDIYENLTSTTNGLVNSGTISGNPGNILDLIIEGSSQNANIRVLSPSDLIQRKTVITNTNSPTNATPQFLYFTASNAQLQGSNILLTLDKSFPSNILGQNIYKGMLINEDTLGNYQAGTIQTVFPESNQILVSGLTGIPTGPASISQSVTIYYVSTLAPTEVITVNNRPAKFLFQEDNTIDIEWGYRSTPTLTRKMRFVVKYVEYMAPESAAPEVKIYCIPTAVSDLQKNHPTIGQAFLDIINLPDGNKNARPITAGAIVQALADQIGYDAQISNTANKLNYDDRVDTNFVTRCTPDMSVLQFISVLAYKVHHHFELGFNYNTGKQKIFFLSDEDYCKKENFVLIWKGGNTLLRSYNIRADFSKLPNGASTAIDPDKPSAGIQTVQQEESSLTLALKSPQETDKSRISTGTTTPVTNGLNNTFNGNAEGVNGTLGSSSYAPSGNVNARKVILDPLIRNSQFPAIITGVMIGFPFMSPCVIRVSNIGRRYSGRYRIMQVKHILDASGYKIEFTGNTNVATDTVQDSVLPSGDKNPTEQTQQVQVRNPTQQTAANNISTLLGIPPLDTNGDAQSYTDTNQVTGKVKGLGGLGAIPRSLFDNSPNNGNNSTSGSNE